MYTEVLFVSQPVNEIFLLLNFAELNVMLLNIKNKMKFPAHFPRVLYCESHFYARNIIISSVNNLVAGFQFHNFTNTCVEAI